MSLSLFHLIYISVAADGLGEEDLLNISRNAVSRNRELDITGVLLYSRGHFIQMLEGEAAAVADLYARIVSDRRHSRCECVCFGPAEDRVFKDWSLGVLNLDVIGHPEDTERLWLSITTRFHTPTDFQQSALGALREFDSILQATGGVVEAFA